MRLKGSERTLLESIPLPGEGGGFPALVTGLPPVCRAHLAAALAEKSGRPLVVLCPDESSADAIGADIAALTGEETVCLTSRDFTFYSADAVSRQAEQKRIGALRAMSKGAAVTVITASGLLQRAIPPESLSRGAFEIREPGTMAMEDAEDALLRCGYSRGVHSACPLAKSSRRLSPTESSVEERSALPPPSSAME